MIKILDTSKGDILTTQARVVRVAFLFFITLVLFSGCKQNDDKVNLNHEPGDGIKTPSAVFTTQGTQLISPEGKPIKLCGWRVANLLPESKLSQDDFEFWDSQGLMGNAQAIEIWWSRGQPSQVSEPYPYKPGVYQTENLQDLLAAMRAMARAGSWIIPSIRVGTNGAAAKEATRLGKSDNDGWAHHKRVIYNDPVVVEEGPYAGTYGNHRDRFFAWLDWLIPAILADEEISSHIAYWEMWHFFGHQHVEDLTDADYDFYFDDFIPRLIAEYRKYDPDRLLGISVRLRFVMEHLLARIDAGTWTPWDDKNWILVYGGYGFHKLLMSDMNFSWLEEMKTNAKWPEDCINPAWLPETNEFDFQKYMRLTDRAIQSQEGPGLWAIYRQTPIPEPQRSFLIHLFNLYNTNTNGFAFHYWPPSQADAIDETDLFNLMRIALRGDSIE